MSRVERERSQDRKHACLEDLPKLLALRLRQICPVDNPDPVSRQLGADVLLEDLCLPSDQLLGACADRVELRLRADPVG